MTEYYNHQHDKQYIDNLWDKLKKGELKHPKTGETLTDPDKILVPISYEDIDAPLDDDKCITLTEATEKLNMTKEPDETEKLMLEKDIDRETAWSLLQDRKEREMIQQKHTEEPTDDEGMIAECSGCHNLFQVSGAYALNVLTGGHECPNCKGTIDIIHADGEKGANLPPSKPRDKNIHPKDRFSTMTNETAKTIPNLDLTLNIQNYFKENENTGKSRLVTAELAKNIIYTKNGINRGILLLDDNKKIYWYNGQYWREDGEELLKDITQRILGEHSCSRHIMETINWIKNCRDIHITREEFDAKTNLIGLQNGVFNLDTYTLEKNTPGSLITTPLNVTYDEKAQCPTFDTFIDDVLYEEDKKVIQEMAGFTLDKSNPIAALFMLVGWGRNGKSTLLNTLIAMLGKHNISSVPIQSIADENFSRIDLYRKYANIVNDLTSKELKNTALLKMLTGHDPIRARDLYEKSMLFYNTAKLISAMNEIPLCDDKTKAWSERVKVVEFPNEFLAGGPKTDQYLYEKLTTPQELSGVFNWAINGLKRLREQKKFSPCKTLEDVAKFLKENKNPVYQFVKQRIKATPQASWVKEDAYKKFLEFAVEKKFPTMGKSPFGENLKRYLTELNIPYREGQSKEHGRVWYDIEFYTPDVPREDAPTVTHEKIDYHSDGNENIDDLPEYTELEIEAGMTKARGKDKDLLMDGWEATKKKYAEDDND